MMFCCIFPSSGCTTPVLEIMQRPRLISRPCTVDNFPSLPKVTRPQIVRTIFDTPAEILSKPSEQQTVVPVVDSGEKPPYQEVKVSHIVSPGEIHMHLVSSDDDLLMFMNAMTKELDANHSPGSSTWTQGDSCVVRCTDQLWYRCKILAVTEDQAEVMHLDYGNKEVHSTADLFVLPPDFVNKAQFSFQCHVADLQPAGDITRWSRTSTEFLTENLKDQICYIVTKGDTENDSVPVDLLIEDIIPGDALTGHQINYCSIGKMLLDKGLALPKRVRKVIIPRDSTKPAIIAAPIITTPAPDIPVANLADQSQATTEEPTARNTEIPSPARNTEIPSPGKSDKSTDDPADTTLVLDEESAADGATDKIIPKETDESPSLPEESTQDNETVIPETIEPAVQSELVQTEKKVTPPPCKVTPPPSTVTPPPSTVTPPPSTVALPPSTVTPPPSTVTPPLHVGTPQRTETPPPLTVPYETLAPPPPCILIDYKPPNIPDTTSITGVPTYVDYDCHVFVQEVKPDDHPQGRLGYMLKENTIEVQLQDSYFKKMNIRRAKIIRDGNCLFRAFAQSMFVNQNEYLQVRQAVIDTLQEYWWLFENVIGEQCSKEKYIENIAKDGTYGGEVEIQAICFFYQIQINLYLGGLHSPITVRSYGNSTGATMNLSYVSDGHYDNGHYDLVVDTPQEADSVEVTYNEWRAKKVHDFQMSDRNFDNNMYEQTILEQMMSYLQAKYQDSFSEDHVTWNIGQAVVGQYSEDNHFYRGKITDINSNGYKVKYVDFGNFQFLPATRLRNDVPLPDIPMQCYECILDQVGPMSRNGKWDDEVLKIIHQKVVGNTYLMHIKDIKDGPVFVIDLIDSKSGDSICQQLIQEGLVKLQPIEDDHYYLEPPIESPPRPSALSPAKGSPVRPEHEVTENGQEMPLVDLVYSYGIPQRQVPSPYPQPKEAEEADVIAATVTQVDSPNTVYLQHRKQPEADESYLQGVNDQLDQLLDVSAYLNAQAETFPPIKDPKPGMACCAKYTLDQCWYRGEILCVNHGPDNYCGVLFVDYGSSEYLPPACLLELPEDMMLLATQAFKCTLSGIEPPIAGDVTSWDPNVTLKMTEALASQTLVAIVRSVETELEVDLFPEDQFFALGLEARLAYADLIEQSSVLFQRLDLDSVAIIEEIYEEEVDGASSQRTNSRLSWADQAEQEMNKSFKVVN